MKRRPSWQWAMWTCAGLSWFAAAPMTAQTTAPPTNSSPAQTVPAEAPTSDDDDRSEPVLEKDPSVSLTDRDRDGRILTSEDVEKAIDPTLSVDTRPVPPEYQAISPLLREKLIEFKKLRDRYLRERIRLEREFKGATAEDRERIREQIRAKWERYFEQSRRLREQHRERLLEMQRELPSHREVLDSVRDRLKERDRVGQD